MAARKKSRIESGGGTLAKSGSQKAMQAIAAVACLDIVYKQTTSGKAHLQQKMYETFHGIAGDKDSISKVEEMVNGANEFKHMYKCDFVEKGEDITSGWPLVHDSSHLQEGGLKSGRHYTRSSLERATQRAKTLISGASLHNMANRLVCVCRFDCMCVGLIVFARR